MARRRSPAEDFLYQHANPGKRDVVEVESGEAKVAGSAEMTKISVRVTSLFRFEDGNWKLVHRHADPLALAQ